LANNCISHFAKLGVFRVNLAKSEIYTEGSLKSQILDYQTDSQEFVIKKE
jgi:hypothetical protein